MSQGTNSSSRATIITSCGSDVLRCSFFSVSKKGNVVPLPNGNWTEGEAFCRTQGTSLVTVHNYTRVEEVKRWMQDNSVTAGWIGLGNVGVWSWSSGSEVTYTKWEVGEPNLLLEEEACGTFSTTSSTWSNSNCSRRHPFYCSGGAARPNSFSFVSSRVCHSEVVKVKIVKVCLGSEIT